MGIVWLSDFRVGAEQSGLTVAFPFRHLPTLSALAASVSTFSRVALPVLAKGIAAVSALWTLQQSVTRIRHGEVNVNALIDFCAPAATLVYLGAVCFVAPRVCAWSQSVSLFCDALAVFNAAIRGDLGHASVQGLLFLAFVPRGRSVRIGAEGALAPGTTIDFMDETGPTAVAAVRAAGKGDLHLPMSLQRYRIPTTDIPPDEIVVVPYPHECLAAQSVAFKPASDLMSGEALSRHFPNVQFTNAHRIFIDPDTVVLEPGVHLAGPLDDAFSLIVSGRTRIGSGSRIDGSGVLVNTTLFRSRMTVRNAYIRDSAFEGASVKGQNLAVTDGSHLSGSIDVDGGTFHAAVTAPGAVLRGGRMVVSRSFVEGSAIGDDVRVLNQSEMSGSIRGNNITVDASTVRAHALVFGEEHRLLDDTVLESRVRLGGEGNYLKNVQCGEGTVITVGDEPGMNEFEDVVFGKDVDWRMGLSTVKDAIIGRDSRVLGTGSALSRVGIAPGANASLERCQIEDAVFDANTLHSWQDAIYSGPTMSALSGLDAVKFRFLN